MKVIIKKTNEVKEVSFGHAVNYLIPQGLAEKATKQRIKQIKARRLKQQADKLKQLKKARQKAKGLVGKRLVFKVKSGKKGKIYGAITKKEIAEKLGVLKSEVILDKPIKKIGEYEVKLKINPPAGEEKCKIKIVIEAE